MKKVIAILLVIVLAIGLIGCANETPVDDTQDVVDDSGAADTDADESDADESDADESNETDESGDTPQESYKLGVILMSLASGSQAYFQKVFNESSADYGFDVTVYDGTDATVQSNAVRECIAEGADAIIISAADSASLIPALQEAKQADIRVGLIGSTLDIMDETTYDFHTGVDDYFAGKASSEAFLAQFPDGANVVEIGGKAGTSPATKRHDGFTEGLEGSGINVLEYQACSDWNANEAMGIMENMIVKYGDEIEGVYVHWDNAATTVIQALQAQNMNDIFVVGVDGCRAGFDQVKDGTQAVTIMQSLDARALKSLEVMQKALKGEAFDEMNMLDWNIVTIDNIDDFIYPEW